jgi:subtilisin family serine protease
MTVRTPGFNPFFGTSAAAPHAAGIAALIKSARPSLTPTEIRDAMISTALDIQAAGIDRDSGYGLVMAPPAVAKALQ